MFDSKLVSIVQATACMPIKILSSKNFDEWNENLNVTINVIHALKYHTLLIKVCS